MVILYLFRSSTVIEAFSLIATPFSIRNLRLDEFRKKDNCFMICCVGFHNYDERNG